MDIAIVGGGSASVALLDALAGSADEFAQSPGSVTVFEPSPQLWRGRPYAADLDSVLVNSIPRLMSIRSGDFGHYSDWLGERGVRHLDRRLGEPLVPRALYGEYLADTGEAALAALRGRGWSCDVVRGRATSIARAGDRLVLSTGDGRQYGASHLALCVGGGTPPDPYGLIGLPGYIHDPYPLSRTLPEIPSESAVSVVGSGLVAVDIVVSLAARGHSGRITLHSRSGMLPHVWQRPNPRISRHLTGERIAGLYQENGFLTLDDIVDLVRAEITDAEESFDDLAAETLDTKEDPVARLRRQIGAIDDPRIGRRLLRESAHQLGGTVWPLLREADRTRLRQYFRTVNAVASPMVPVNAVTVLEMLDAGRLTLAPGLRGIEPVSGGFRVHDATGTGTADTVINAVNPAPQAVPVAARGLVDSLVATGLVARHREGGVTPADSRVHVVGDSAGGGSFMTSSIPALAGRAALTARALRDGERFATPGGSARLPA